MPKDTTDFILLKSIGIEFGDKLLDTPDQKSLLEKINIDNKIEKTKVRRTLLGAALGIPIGFIFLIVNHASGPFEGICLMIVFVVVCALVGRALGELRSLKTKK